HFGPAKREKEVPLPDTTKSVPETAVQPPPTLVGAGRPAWVLVLVLAWPVLAQQSLVFLVKLSDRFLAGWFSPEVAFQAAQTTAAYMSWVITNYTVFVTVGSTALVARFVGAGDRAAAVPATPPA